MTSVSCRLSSFYYLLFPVVCFLPSVACLKGDIISSHLFSIFYFLFCHLFLIVYYLSSVCCLLSLVFCLLSSASCYVPSSVLCCLSTTVRPMLFDVCHLYCMPSFFCRLFPLFRFMYFLICRLLFVSFVCRLLVLASFRLSSVFFLYSSVYVHLSSVFCRSFCVHLNLLFKVRLCLLSSVVVSYPFTVLSSVVRLQPFSISSLPSFRLSIVPYLSSVDSFLYVIVSSLPRYIVLFVFSRLSSLFTSFIFFFLFSDFCITSTIVCRLSSVVCLWIYLFFRLSPAFRLVS